MAEKMYAADYADVFARYNCDSRFYYLNPYMSISTNLAGLSSAARDAAIRSGWQVWRCPSTRPPWDSYHVGYSLNDYGDGQTYTWFTKGESEIPDPANVIMWGDGGWNIGFTAAGIPNTCNTRVLQGIGASTAWIDGGLTYDPPFWPMRTAGVTNMQFAFIGRHNGKCNFNFVDGHAKAMDLKEVAHRMLPAPLQAYFFYFTWYRPATTS